MCIKPVRTKRGQKSSQNDVQNLETYQLPPPPLCPDPELLPAAVDEDVEDEDVPVAEAVAPAHKLVNQPCMLDRFEGSSHALSQTPEVPVLKGWREPKLQKQAS